MLRTLEKNLLNTFALYSPQHSELHTVLSECGSTLSIMVKDCVTNTHVSFCQVTRNGNLLRLSPEPELEDKYDVVEGTLVVISNKILEMYKEVNESMDKVLYDPSRFVTLVRDALYRFSFNVRTLETEISRKVTGEFVVMISSSEYDKLDLVEVVFNGKVIVVRDTREDKRIELINIQGAVTTVSCMIVEYRKELDMAACIDSDPEYNVLCSEYTKILQSLRKYLKDYLVFIPTTRRERGTLSSFGLVVVCDEQDESHIPASINANVLIGRGLLECYNDNKALLLSTSCDEVGLQLFTEFIRSNYFISCRKSMTSEEGKSPFPEELFGTDLEQEMLDDTEEELNGVLASLKRRPTEDVGEINVDFSIHSFNLIYHYKERITQIRFNDDIELAEYVSGIGRFVKDYI